MSFEAPAEDLQTGGFEAPADEHSDWANLPKNILPDAAAMASNAVGTAGRIAKGVADLPSDLLETGRQELSGGNPLETPIAQDVKTVGNEAINAVKSIPESIGNLASKDAWIEHPVQNAVTAGSLVAPMFAPEEGGMAARLGKGMENKGANMAADLAEVSGRTVERTRPETLGPEGEAGIRKAGGTPNVADVRTQLGKKLVNDEIVGGVGQSVGDRLQKVSEIKNDAGKEINSVREEIRKTNRASGEYEGVDDPIHVQANPILKSVLDIANELRNSARSGIRQASRFWRETYNSLATKAEANNGRLTLDDIHKEMQDVGKDLDSSPKSPRFNAASDIYAHLAETQEKMLTDFADTLWRDDLKQRLLDANKRYTLSSKLELDLKGPSASGSPSAVGGPSPQRAALRGSPIRAGVYAAIQSIKPALAEALVKGGPKMAKYGPYLESAARQGPKNLALADMILRQNDESYAELTQ